MEYFKKFDNWTCSTFIRFFAIVIINCCCYHTHVQNFNTFFNKHSSKVGILQRRKARPWKTFNKIELSEEFMAMWREEKTLWDVIFPLYPDKNEKGNSLKRMPDKFQIFSDWHFWITFCFKCEIFFQLTPDILKFQLCF